MVINLCQNHRVNMQLSSQIIHGKVALPPWDPVFFNTFTRLFNKKLSEKYLKLLRYFLSVIRYFLFLSLFFIFFYFFLFFSFSFSFFLSYLFLLPHYFPGILDPEDPKLFPCMRQISSIRPLLDIWPDTR